MSKHAHANLIIRSQKNARPERRPIHTNIPSGQRLSSPWEPHPLSKPLSIEARLPRCKEGKTVDQHARIIMLRTRAEDRMQLASKYHQIAHSRTIRKNIDKFDDRKYTSVPASSRTKRNARRLDQIISSEVKGEISPPGGFSKREGA